MAKRHLGSGEVVKSIFRRQRGLPRTSGAGLPASTTTADDGAQEDRARALFKVPANTRLWRTPHEAPNYAGEVTKLYREVFTPSQPKQSVADFVGRRDTIEKITQAIEEERAHILLLGHRLLGKSSILNVMAESARQAGYLVTQTRCTADLTFNAFMRGVFEELSVQLAEAPAGGVLTNQLGVERLSDLLDPEAQDVQSALRAFSRIATQQILILVDDFHCVRDTALKHKISDLIATLHAHDISVCMMIAARDETVDEVDLFDGEQPSGAVTLRIGPMRSDEIREMLTNGGRQLSIRFGEEVLQAIDILCQGIPAIAQWLGLLTVRRALQRYDDAVTLDDIAEAAQTAAVKADHFARTRLDEALASENGERFDSVLFLAALASTPEAPIFSPDDLNRTAARTGNRPITAQGLHRLLNRHSTGEHAIFERVTATKTTNYRFTDPLTRPLVLLRNASRPQPSNMDVLAAYLEHQQQPQPGMPSDSSSEFLRWLQFVLTSQDMDRYNAWARQDPGASDEFRRQFRRAHDDDALETLLRGIQSVLKHENGGPEASTDTTMDAA